MFKHTHDWENRALALMPCMRRGSLLVSSLHDKEMGIFKCMRWNIGTGEAMETSLNVLAYSAKGQLTSSRQSSLQGKGRIGVALWDGKEREALQMRMCRILM